MQSTFTLSTRVLTLCGALLLTTSLQAQCTVNLIANNNPDFEQFNGDGSVAWWYTFGNGAIGTSTDTPDGSANSGMTVVPATGSQNVYIAQGNRTVTPGVEYRLSAMVKIDNAGGAGAYAAIGMNFRNSSGNDISAYHKEFLDLSATGWNMVSITQTAVETNGSGDAAELVQLFFEVGSGASILVDQVVFEDITPVTPATPCANSKLPGGTFFADLEGFGNDNGSGNVVFSADEGADCSGALRITAQATSGFYGIPAASGEFIELTFEAKAIVDAGFPNGELIFFNANYSANYDAAKVEIQGGDIQPYRVVTAANNPDIANLAVQFTGASGADIVIDNVCARDFTPNPVVPVAGNLIADGDFENGTPFSATTFNQSPTQDPSTGLGAQMFNRAAYGFGATPRIPVTGGVEYTVLLDVKRVGTVQYSKLNYLQYDAAGAQIGGRVDNNLTTTEGSYVTNTLSITPDPAAVEIRLEYESDDGGQANGYTVLDNLAMFEAILLPVELADFSGQNTGKTNRLRWATATEENTEMFYLERSRNGVDAWEQVSMLPAAGNSRVRQEYEVLDAQPFNETYYRLRSVDFDGSEQTFDVIRLTLANTTDLRAYPNPVTSQLTVETTLETATDYQLFDALGRRLLTGRIAAGSVRTLLPTADLPSGRYVLRVGERSISVIK